ncbi:DUF3320 domain-containing protein [Henriciella litoralis]|uniref:DUF3320 domain-containing protein n=1 Tax=Henriciella litoralis TaxID=568102 RepID=UPI000A00B7A4|nr:DUF3320 domain-containing protein [Henriciella litoralis]
MPLDTPSQTGENPQRNNIVKLLEDARRRLVETGTRNRLVHTNRTSNRSKVVNVINERADDVYQLLRIKSKRMKFLALGKDEKDDTPETFSLAATTAHADFDEARFTDNLLETALGPDKLAKRLLSLARDAKTGEEEQGINLLYLAIGFLNWREDKSSAVDRSAPLILLPVELVRNQQTSTYDLKCRSDEIVTNLPLQERLREDFGIILPDIDESEDWSPAQYFDLVQPLVEERKHWSLDRDGMQLGLFSFAKILMMRDLDPQNWSGTELIDHDLISGLLVSGFEPEPPLFPEKANLDEYLEPKDLLQVVDADASQTKVVEEVRAGRNLVVQGPPGTGKSQTITNIIASAVYDGKTVLFLAEKMAALSVVHKRLVDSGLEDICLELHSRNANKKSVLVHLKKTLSAAATGAEVSDSSTNLKAIRDQLNDVSTMLHQPVPGHSFSAYDALGRLIRSVGKDTPPPKLEASNLADLPQDELDRVREGLTRYGSLIEEIGNAKQHPFAGTNELGLQPTDLERIKRDAANLAETIDSIREQLSGSLRGLHIQKEPTINMVDRLLRFAEHVSAAPCNTASLVDSLEPDTSLENLEFAAQKALDYTEAWAVAGSTYVEAALAHEMPPLRTAIAGGTSFWSRLGGKYRSASKELASLLKQSLPKTQLDRLSLIDNVIELQKKRSAYISQSSQLRVFLGNNWREEETDFQWVLNALEWLIAFQKNNLAVSQDVLKSVLTNADNKILSSLPQKHEIDALKSELKGVINKLKLNVEWRFSSKASELPLKEFQDLLSKISAQSGRYDQWREYYILRKFFSGLSLASLITRIDKGELTPAGADAELLYARAEAQWHICTEALPKLADLRDTSRHDLVQAFRELEENRIIEIREAVRLRHLNQVPRGAVGEMQYIRGELARKRGHKSIRKLMENAGTMLQRIKPALLMSPISVAQFLPPDSITFDLLVIDEASQVRPEDALGAIVRARQIVVVGDQKQLPPTSFFDRVSSPDEQDEDDALSDEQVARPTELESILTLCDAKGLRQEMLEWHYRSRDPSLIKVSNSEFYDHRLILPPSPLERDESYGLKLTRVPGVYARKGTESGRPSTNRIEGQAIVKRVAEHARKSPNQSLGVVTFSMAQRAMVEELLEFERRTDATLDQFLREGRNEDFFVKNIENVQGDERDVILISVCYGPLEPNGKLASMSFGPVNSEGGERRLNVLFSRARIRCEVFVSFNPRDIDLSRTQKEGPRVLKRFLEFAQTGHLDEKVATGFLADSPFEEDVGDVIRRLGYDLDHQVGSGGFLIDIGVKNPKHPGQYLMAVECDGATYHSALWARERDRLRQGVLEHLGWKFHRIWSTDWFHRRDHEIERLKRVLEQATEQSSEGVSVSGANDFDPLGEPEEEGTDWGLEVPLETPQLKGEPYKRFEHILGTSREPHDVATASLSKLAEAVIQTEGPVHEEEVARRVAYAFGKERTGARIVDATGKALKHLSATTPEVFSVDGFWMTKAQHSNPVVRDRSGETGPTLKGSMIPPIEIAMAKNLIFKECGAVDREELVKAIAYMFGFKRVGPDLRSSIERVLEASPRPR